MNRDEFISKLKSAYKLDQFTEQNIEDLEQWINDEYINDLALKDLLKNIKLHYKYKTFPRLCYVADIYNKNRKQEQKIIINPTLDRYKNQNINLMLNTLRDIQSRDADGLTNEEIDYIYHYADMLYVWNIIKDSDMSEDERDVYMRKVKETIQAGGVVNRGAFEKFRRNKAS